MQNFLNRKIYLKYPDWYGLLQMQNNVEHMVFVLGLANASASASASEFSLVWHLASSAQFKQVWLCMMVWPTLNPFIRIKMPSSTWICMDYLQANWLTGSSVSFTANISNWWWAAIIYTRVYIYQLRFIHIDILLLVIVMLHVYGLINMHFIDRICSIVICSLMSTNAIGYDTDNA